MKPINLVDSRKPSFASVDSASANPLFSHCVAAWAWLSTLDCSMGEHIELYRPVMAESAAHYE